MSNRCLYDSKGCPFEELRARWRAGGWRLGTTSCLCAGGLLENVLFLAGCVDDVELVLFEAAEVNNWPSNAELRRLRSLSEEYDLTFTVHVPCHLRPLDPSEHWEVICRDWLQKTIDICEGLCPLSYVWHWETEHFGATPSDDMQRWKERWQNLAAWATKFLGVTPDRLAVETLSYPFELIADLIELYDFSVTLDVGHLWSAHYDWRDYLAKYGKRVKVVHLHGVHPETGEDHLKLDFVSPLVVREVQNELLHLCSRSPRALSLEVFNAEDWQSSLKVLAELETSKVCF